jgi:streptogramin lyase
MGSLRFAVLVAAMLAGCAAPAATQTPPSAAPPSPTAPTSTAAATSAVIPAIIKASIPLTHLSAGIDVGPDGVWLRAPDGHVLKVDPATNRITADIEVRPSEFGDIKSGADSVWVTDFDHDTLMRIDPNAGKVVKSITVGTNPEWLTVTPETVWVSNHRAGSISKVDVESNKVAATFTFAPPGASGPRGIILLDGSLWTSAANSNSVYRLDPTSGAVIKKLLIAKGDIHSLITDGRLLYLPAGGALMQIDPETNTVTKELQYEAFPMAFTRSAFWSITGRSLVRLDPDTFEVAARWQLVPDSDPEVDIWGVAFDEDDLWILNTPQTLLRVSIPG